MNASVVVAALVVVPLAIAARAAGARRAILDDRRRTARALRRMAAVIDESSTADRQQALDAVCRGMADVLHGTGCRFERRPWAQALPTIGADGDVEARVQRRVPSGIVLPAQTAVAAGPAGRFVVLADPDAGTSVDERLIAVALARFGGRIHTSAVTSTTS